MGIPETCQTGVEFDQLRDQLMVTSFVILSSSEVTLFVVVVLCLLLMIGVLAGFKSHGNFFGKFRVGGVSGEVKSSTPPGIDVKNSSAQHIQITERTGSRVAAEGLKAGKKIVITTELPNDHSPK